jgi:hypothetical protein
MRGIRLACIVAALASFPGCLNFGAKTEESSRLVMGMYDQGTILQKTQQTIIRIGDREQVASVLMNVFGPNANSVVSENILKKPAQFGGPCDYMSEASQSDMNCQFDDIGVATVPSITSALEALRTQACDRIAQDDAAIRYAAAQAREVSDGSFIQSEPPGIADIKAAYELFRPGHPLPDDIASNLKTGVVGGAMKSGGSVEGWRFLFLTLCLSPDWQLL